MSLLFSHYVNSLEKGIFQKEKEDYLAKNAFLKACRLLFTPTSISYQKP